MHEYTQSGNWKLKIEIDFDVLEDGNPSPQAGKWGIGEWGGFSVASEADKYKLDVGSRSRQDNMAGNDPLTPSRGRFFSTQEEGRDNDSHESHCAERYGGGWWFSNCVHFCLNLNPRIFKCNDVSESNQIPTNESRASNSLLWFP